MNKSIFSIFLILFFAAAITDGYTQEAKSGDDFSIINVYRQRSGGGNSTQYRLYFNDRLIQNFSSGLRLSYKIFSVGELKVKTDALFMGNTLPGESTLTLPIESGKTYYLELSNKSVSLVSESEGKTEFNDLSEYKDELVKKEEDKIVPILTMPEPTAKPQQETEVYSEYRGSGDPLKGLNVSKSKDMVIGNYYAVIIGIDKYTGKWPPLQNAVNDAKSVESTLKGKYKFDYFHSLYNEQASRKAIIAELEWLVKNTKAEDNVFIYYSGHGEFKKELNKGFWVPVDAMSNTTADYISNNDIQTYLGGIKSKHTLLVTDACFSGDLFRGSTVSVPFENSEKYYKEVHGLVSRQAFTSGGIEPVMDGGKDGHSVFAFYLLKSLNENENKFFDASQLYDRIKIPVVNNSEQTPKLAPLKDTGDEGGQFIFIKK
jgi:hypothetical protein